jgi:hypothetical protein
VAERAEAKSISRRFVNVSQHLPSAKGLCNAFSPTAATTAATANALAFNSLFFRITFLPI